MCELSAPPDGAARGGFLPKTGILLWSGRSFQPHGECSTTHTREHEDVTACEAAPSSAPDPQHRADERAGGKAAS